MGSEIEKNLEIASHHRKKWTKSSVCLQLNFLPAFEAGDFYDCTIRVGCDLQNSDSSFRVCLILFNAWKSRNALFILQIILQDFKCHKLVLSACSPMFETMYFSHFKEAKMGPDEPIWLDRIDPQVFESTMR
jgi:hypothetical protein